MCGGGDRSSSCDDGSSEDEISRFARGKKKINRDPTHDEWGLWLIECFLVHVADAVSWTFTFTLVVTLGFELRSQVVIHGVKWGNW